VSWKGHDSHIESIEKKDPTAALSIASVFPYEVVTMDFYVHVLDIWC
jgi:hypothetical protein